jgi:hypothetical protein
LSRYSLVSFLPKKAKKDTAAIGARLEISVFKTPFSWTLIWFLQNEEKRNKRNLKAIILAAPKPKNFAKNEIPIRFFTSNFPQQL